MTGPAIKTGGATFTGLKWKLRPAKKGSDNLGYYESGPYTITRFQKKGRTLFNVFVIISTGDSMRLGGGTTLVEAQKIADDNARAALLFGARPVEVKS